MASKPISYKERPRALDLAISITLLDYLKERSTAYLNKIRFFVFNAFDILVDKSIISRELKCLNFNRKKCRRIVAQRYQDLRDY